MVIAHLDFTNKESRDSTHRVIALVDLSVNNKQVIAPIVVDYESIYNKNLIDINLVSTYFNKNSNLDKLLDNKKNRADYKNYSVMAPPTGLEPVTS